MKRLLALAALAAMLALPATALAQEPFSATLTGAAETPPVTTDASGSGSFVISDDESSVEFEVTFTDLSGPATMAHIHYGTADAPGPIMIWLTVVGVTDGSYTSPISGTATDAEFAPVTDGPQTFAEALDAIRAGNSYVNVHTQANPGGEIRGQIGELPDTATAEQAAPYGVPWTIALVALGLAVLLPVARRFAMRVA